MEYRVLPHGGEQISVIGFGGSGLKGSVEEMTGVKIGRASCRERV